MLSKGYYQMQSANKCITCRISKHLFLMHSVKCDIFYIEVNNPTTDDRYTATYSSSFEEIFFRLVWYCLH